MKLGAVYIFADVTIYCIKKKTADQAVAHLDKDLTELYDWCIVNPHQQKSEENADF